MNNNLILDVEQNPKKISQWILFAIQHVLAMLVACITVPMLTGLPIGATLISAGIGTLCYILFTKKKSPVFLSSSFAYLAPMSSALAVGLISGSSAERNYLALILGMVMVGLVYCIVGLVVKFVGTKWLNKLLPPIVIGPVIMVIGLSLAGSAIGNITRASGSGASYNLLSLLCGIVALFVTAACSHYGKGKTLSLIPFVMGMSAGYVLALLLTIFGYTLGNNELFNIVNFKPLTDIFGEGNFSLASIFNYKILVPDDSESFIFLRFSAIKDFDWAKIGQVMLLFIPVSFVTICEHIGDHENLGNILGRDLLNKDPGMTRTLTGDGVATALSGILCGAANTTYGENVAVVGTTKIASVNVVLLAAVFSIVIGFFTPFTAVLSTIPACVTGGVSLVLYGFIASSGVKMLIQTKTDLSNSKNIFIASAILVAGIGGLSLQLFPSVITNVEQLTVTLENGSTQVLNVLTSTTKYAMTITSTAIAMILGILLNVFLKDKKEEEVK